MKHKPLAFVLDQPKQQVLRYHISGRLYTRLKCPERPNVMALYGAQESDGGKGSKRESTKSWSGDVKRDARENR